MFVGLPNVYRSGDGPPTMRGKGAGMAGPRGDLALSQECQHKTKILTGKANLQGSWVPPASRLR